MRSGLLENCKAVSEVHSRRQHLPTAGRQQRHAGTSADLVSNSITLESSPGFSVGVWQAGEQICSCRVRPSWADVQVQWHNPFQPMTLHPLSRPCR